MEKNSRTAVDLYAYTYMYAWGLFSRLQGYNGFYAFNIKGLGVALAQGYTGLQGYKRGTPQ
jgi:hypothetical protein